MRRSKSSEAQIAFVLMQAEDGTSVGEVCRETGIRRSDVLRLTQEACGTDAVGDAAAAPVRGGERQVVDTFGRFSPVVVPRFSFPAPDVVKVLERVCGELSYPVSIRVA